MRYEGIVIRPPSEANSFILQATIGCSHNKCTFCGTYQLVKFRKRSLDEIKEDIDMASDYFLRNHIEVKRVFLADGDVLCLSTKELISILDYLEEKFNQLERVGIYSNAWNILEKTDEELKILREKKLGIVYLGLESGSDKILTSVKKGAGSAQMIEAVKKAKKAGMKTSVIVLLGLGGKEMSVEHVEKSARVLNEMNPDYLSALVLMLIPFTPLARKCARGEFETLNSHEILEELKILVENLNLKGTIFRSNHASNYLPLKGTFPQDKKKLLKVIDLALNDKVPLRPNYLRAL